MIKFIKDAVAYAVMRRLYRRDLFVLAKLDRSLKMHFEYVDGLNLCLAYEIMCTDYYNEQLGARKKTTMFDHWDVVEFSNVSITEDERTRLDGLLTGHVSVLFVIRDEMARTKKTIDRIMKPFRALCFTTERFRRFHIQEGYGR